MPFSYQYGHQLADKMVLHEVGLTMELNTASNIRSKSCGAVDNKNPRISTIRSKSEVPSGRKAHSSTKDEGLGIALEQQSGQHIEDRKQKPLDDSQRIQDLSSDGPGKPDGLKVPCEESPPPEIISVRKVQRARLTNTTTSSSPLHLSLPAHQRDRLLTNPHHSPPTYNMSNKRQQPQTGESETKRQKMTVSYGSLEGDLNQLRVTDPNEDMSLSRKTYSSVDGYASSLADARAKRARAKQSISLAGAPLNIDLVANAAYSSVSDNFAAQTKEHLDQNEVTKPPNTETRSKRWTARTWTSRQYFDLAEQTWLSFPVEDYMRKHNKTLQEVREVFMGIVRLPALAQAQRGVGLPRGGVGEERMKEFRKMEKEAIQASRVEADQEEKQEVAEEKLMKDGTLPAVVCEDCKKKVVKPTTKAEAAANMSAAFKEYSKAAKIYERLAAKEVARASETTEKSRKRAAKSNANSSK